MNSALPAALEQAPLDLVASMPVNEKDRHVLALAVHVEASVIVTFNLRDFPNDACEPYGIEASSAPPPTLSARFRLNASCAVFTSRGKFLAQPVKLASVPQL